MTDLFEALRSAAAEFAPALAREAHARGLAVTSADGSNRPIPVTATPVVIDGPTMRARARLSALLASAGAKMALAVVRGNRRELLLGALSPLERAMAEKTYERAAQLVTTRVDYFLDRTGAPHALELNATIPAMQGYSDIAARAFVEIAGRHFGLDEREISRLQEATPSNALALYQALLSGYRERRGREPRRIALLCRRNDAQLTEQLYLAARFRGWGAEAEVVHPDQLSLSERGVEVEGRVYDLVYRHLFVRRLEDPTLQGGEVVKALLLAGPDAPFVVLNPPASQVEVKAAFALLSQAREEPALAAEAGLTDEELQAIDRSIPWTRVFRAGPARGADGKRWSDLVAAVAAEPDRFVLKRSWDYGGRAVFVGRTSRDSSFEERVRAAYGQALTWPELCARTAVDPAGGGFVVQQVVDAAPQAHLLCHPQGVVEAELFVDFSAYASVGLAQSPAWGGVCRGSPSHIVNIVGGGGVLPVIDSSVADALAAARLRAKG